ncbi:unnamed protein product [Ixodes pacificus]
MCKSKTNCTSYMHLSLPHVIVYYFYSFSLTGQAWAVCVPTKWGCSLVLQSSSKRVPSTHLNVCGETSSSQSA